jgi:hypothetical protein
MNDPLAIRFVNERVRPRCEMIRALKILLEDDLEQWFNNEINTTIPNDSSGECTIEDGRQSQGVSLLYCDEIHTIMARLSEVLEPLQAANAMDLIHKACVRNLSVDSDL